MARSSRQNNDIEQPKRLHQQLKQDQLVEKIVLDPDGHQATIALNGFVGKGSQEGVWRLYLSPDLDEYVEFNDNDALHHEALPAEHSPLGGTTVWLKAEATLRHVQVTSRQTQAGFLKGSITSGFMPSTRFAGAVPAVLGTGAYCTRNYVCSLNPHIPACHQRTDYNCGSIDACPVTGALCGTGAFVC